MGRSLRFVEDVFDAMDEIERLEDERRIEAVAKQLVGTVGYTTFMVTRLPQPRNNRLTPYVLLNSYPDAWTRRYDAMRYYRDDPVASHCFAATLPFVWSDVPVAEADALRARRVMGEACEFGMRDGFTVPIHDLHGFQAAVSMAGPAPVLPPDALRALHLLAIATFSAAERLSGRAADPLRPRLSPREREVLVWLSAGLSQAEVGDKLGISRTTVETHIMSARHKLGAANALHAVVEALRAREIRP